MNVAPGGDVPVKTSTLPVAVDNMGTSKTPLTGAKSLLTHRIEPSRHLRSSTEPPKNTVSQSGQPAQLSGPVACTDAMRARIARARARMLAKPPKADMLGITRTRQRFRFDPEPQSWEDGGPVDYRPWHCASSRHQNGCNDLVIANAPAQRASGRCFQCSGQNDFCVTELPPGIMGLAGRRKFVVRRLYGFGPGAGALRAKKTPSARVSKSNCSNVVDSD
jgi:hypothetical protein